MMAIMKDLFPLNRVFCSSDYDRSVAYLSKILPFRVIEYSSEMEHNGWIIPPKWDLKEAKIIMDGNVIYDGTKTALGVITLSKSYSGTVDLEELRRHLNYDNRFDDAIPFHFRQQYRSWNRDWGFCVTKNFYDSLKPGTYEVIIETEESIGYLKLLEYKIQGDLDETVVFAAHLDHPGLANDDLAGCAVGVELFRQLSKKKTKFSYILFLHQEIIGSEYYLAMMSDQNRSKIIESCFLEMLGSKTQLGLQESRKANSNIEKAIEISLKERRTDFRKGSFDSIVTNGDYIWESYGIPMASLSRFPYPEYHCDKDNLDIISESSLNESVDILSNAIEIIEKSTLIEKIFKGNICVSNPKYSLYIELGVGQEAVAALQNTTERKLRTLMDIIPTLDKPVTSKILAEQIELPEKVVLKYLRQWSEKGLLRLT
jgi:aminopeptidase-like protein